jgi:uncharacterized protein YegJ (DUF2314 family)
MKLRSVQRPKRRGKTSLAVMCVTLALSLALSLGACENNQTDSTTGAATSTKDNRRSISNANVVQIPEDDAELTAAIAEARRTAEDARTKWSNANAAGRERWWVKWAAATDDGNFEHVWVQPINWSPFRVEGVLISPPVNTLATGKSAGDIVSFPIEELSDWMHLRAGSSLNDFNKLYDGGFTVKVLENRQSQP